MHLRSNKTFRKTPHITNCQSLMPPQEMKRPELSDWLRGIRDKNVYAAKCTFSFFLQVGQNRDVSLLFDTTGGGRGCCLWPLHSQKHPPADTRGCNSNWILCPEVEIPWHEPTHTRAVASKELVQPLVGGTEWLHTIELAKGTGNQAEVVSTIRQGQ